MRVSQYFKLRKSQPYLDFVDIKLDTDLPVFVNPGAIRTLRSHWGQECASLVQRYFDLVLRRITQGHDADAQRLLSCLNERNEFHLGFSRKRSRGHGFGTDSAESVWSAMTKSRASYSGLLKDLEDTCLLIDGIGPDMISDAMCNIIRGPLIKYTQDMCVYYGIPLMRDVSSGPVWNAQSGVWEESLVRLPIADQDKFILVPKVVVRRDVTFKFDKYYRHYLLPQMQRDEIQANTSLVHLLKDGRKRVTKSSLQEKYGSNKLAVVDETIKRPHVLQKYKDDQERTPAPPLAHEELAEIEGTKRPDWGGLLSKLKKIRVGREHASRYEDIVEKILSALFYPSLCSPTKQDQIHNGRKRIDITYTNEAKNGFFYWLGLNYPSGFIFVECKNYGREIGNPELDQLAGRFSPSRGKVGILVCRSIADRKRIIDSCIDTASDSRGFILVLDDSEIEQLVEEAMTELRTHAYALLRQQFNTLVK